MKVIKEIDQNSIFWYKNDFDVYQINTLHIKFVLREPEKFGFTYETLKNIYEEYNEPIGTEGRARQEILKRVLRNGWIRIRYVPSRNNTWFIEVDNFQRRKHIIKRCIEYFLIIKDKMKKNDVIELWQEEDLYTKNRVIDIFKLLEVKDEK